MRSLTVLLCLLFALPASAQTNRPWAVLCPADADAFTGCTVKGTKRMVAVCIPKGARLEPTGEDDAGKIRMATPKVAFMRYRVGTATQTRLIYPPKRENSVTVFKYGLVTYAAGWASRFAARDVTGKQKDEEMVLVERNLAGERDASGRRKRDITHYFAVTRNGVIRQSFRCDDDNQK